jgi:hypothetical protein
MAVGPKGKNPPEIEFLKICEIDGFIKYAYTTV